MRVAGRRRGCAGLWGGDNSKITMGKQAHEGNERMATGSGDSRLGGAGGGGALVRPAIGGQLRDDRAAARTVVSGNLGTMPAGMVECGADAPRVRVVGTPRTDQGHCRHTRLCPSMQFHHGIHAALWLQPEGTSVARVESQNRKSEIGNRKSEIGNRKSEQGGI
jgi:hypothetical protein